MELAKKIQQFFLYWYVRYLLATELYMVEIWETIIVHFLFGLIFGLFWYFNISIVTRCISQLRNTTTYDFEQMI